MFGSSSKSNFEINALHSATRKTQNKTQNSTTAQQQRQQQIEVCLRETGAHASSDLHVQTPSSSASGSPMHRRGPARADRRHNETATSTLPKLLALTERNVRVDVGCVVLFDTRHNRRDRIIATDTVARGELQQRIEAAGERSTRTCGSCALAAPGVVDSLRKRDGSNRAASSQISGCQHAQRISIVTIQKKKKKKKKKQ